jgi:Tfp pilus assembly protein PilN
MSTTAPDASAEYQTTHAPAAAARLPIWQRALAFGTGFGIEIAEDSLHIAIVRARPAGPAQVDVAVISAFRNRPAAEWGAEIARFIAASGGSGLAATVLLPRSEVIIRTLNLPGVADKDIPNAVDLQVDTLHPWGDADVLWGWSRVAKATILVGLARKDVLDGYETLFAEAGILLAAITFSPAVIHAALRIWNSAPHSLLCFNMNPRGRVEVYGESESRPVFAAEFPMPKERALALARAELRLPEDYPAGPLSVALPDGASDEESALAYAAALAGSAPRAARFANLLPAERRASHDRVQYVVPGFLCALLLLALLAAFVIFPALEQKRYREALDRATRQLEPSALRAQAADKKIVAERSRIVMLDDLKKRSQADLDVLNELTRLLPPPAWTASIEINPDSVVIAGEADQAEPLLKTIDASPLFQNSEFSQSVTRSGATEQFRIKIMRRGRAGRTTP